MEPGLVRVESLISIGYIQARAIRTDAIIIRSRWKSPARCNQRPQFSLTRSAARKFRALCIFNITAECVNGYLRAGCSSTLSLLISAASEIRPISSAPRSIRLTNSRTFIAVTIGAGRLICPTLRHLTPIRTIDSDRE